jgi:Fe-S-cluster containining protein
VTKPCKAEESSSLCTDCGLCCDGTLFARARVRPEAVHATTELGFHLAPRGEHYGFALPCPRLAGTCCTIYETRPGVCRTFRCALLVELNTGKVTLDAARATVLVAKTLLARAVETDARARYAQPRWDLRDELAARRATGDREDLAARATLELTLHVLQKQLHRFGRPQVDATPV